MLSAQQSMKNAAFEVKEKLNKNRKFSRSSYLL